ncbi:MAG: DNA-3-methyladenine glycosylase [Myxococcota bacterium]
MLLPQSFYARDALHVARDLIGKLIQHEDITLRITETEAYRHPGDTANHCRFGKTKRNAVMFGPPGYAYVYLCYGLHNMLNFVTNQEEEGAAVLIRSCEPVEGMPTILKRRKNIKGPALLTGPGKVAAASGLTTANTYDCLFEPGGLMVLDAPSVSNVLAGPRVGIEYASESDRLAPWRFALADSPWVSRRSQLSVAFKKQY